MKLEGIKKPQAVKNEEKNSLGEKTSDLFMKIQKTIGSMHGLQ